MYISKIGRLVVLRGSQLSSGVAKSRPGCMPAKAPCLSRSCHAISHEREANGLAYSRCPANANDLATALQLSGTSPGINSWPLTASHLPQFDFIPYTCRVVDLVPLCVGIQMYKTEDSCRVGGLTNAFLQLLECVESDKISPKPHNKRSIMYQILCQYLGGQ